MYGNPETTPGGNALKFYASVRMDIRKSTAIKVGDAVIGNRARVKVVKNKMAPPFKVAEFDIMYNEGISRTGSILDVATDMGIIEKRGSWFSFDGEQLGQGRDQTKQLLADNPELQNRINDRIKERIAADKAANVPAKNAVAAETAENN
jgi:recombination protein RecA